MKGEINSNTITVGNFNIPCTSMDRSTKQKTNKEIQLGLIDIYKAFHPKTIDFNFLSSVH